jgi:hypothetical protein
MPAIKFLKNKNTGKLVRPQGGAFPVGLTSGAVDTFSIDYLVVGGGGGGGQRHGGGAGGFLTGSNYGISSITNYSVTVGGGGQSSQESNDVSTRISLNGSNSKISLSGTDLINAQGGGFGGVQPVGNPGSFNYGGIGGSGGGAVDPAIMGPAPSFPGTNAVPGQGNRGGWGVNGCGGGGASAVGLGTPADGGGGKAGGNGTASPYSGNPVTYAGGGGGSDNSGASGGSGGGGTAATYNAYNAQSGSPNTGGGGGATGGGAGTGTAGTGGSGIVIIRYAGAQAAGGGSYSSSGGFSIHTFTGDGTFRANTTGFFIN